MALLYTLYAGDFDRSIEEAEAAIEMAPNEAGARSQLGQWLSMAGRHDQAIEWASTALRQEHNAASAMFLKVNLAWVLYFAGRYEEALENIKGSETAGPDVAAVIDVRLGRVEEAPRHHCRLAQDSPNPIATESCWAMKEPMKSAWLDDRARPGCQRNRADVRGAPSPLLSCFLRRRLPGAQGTRYVSWLLRLTISSPTHRGFRSLCCRSRT